MIDDVNAEIINQANIFVRRIHDLEITLSPRASTSIYVINKSINDPITGFRSHLNEETRTFADFLGTSMDVYIKAGETVKVEQAKVLSIWIQRAYANGFIIEGTGNLQKLDEYKLKNAQLEKDLQVISVKYNELAKKYKEFQKRFPEPLKQGWDKNVP